MSWVSGLLKILLLMSICCQFAFTQWSYLNYKGNFYLVSTKYVGFIVKEGYYNDELLEKLSEPPYSIAFASEKYRSIVLSVSGDIMNINILDHYLKFEKEQFVENVFPQQPGSIGLPDPSVKFYIKGQVLQNGIPLANHIVNLIQGQYTLYNSIADENGNYLFPDIKIGSTCDISLKVGNTRYTTTVVVDENEVVNLDIASMVGGVNEKEFDIKGQVIHDGEPLANHAVHIYANKFNYVYGCMTDENGNYSFPKTINYSDYTIFVEVGPARYDTTFVLDDNKIINFNLVSTWEEFDVKGRILYDGKPLANYNVKLSPHYAGGDVYYYTTDEDGNFIFPKMIGSYFYSMWFDIGNITYGSTIMLDDDKIINFDLLPFGKWVNFRVRLLQNGQPLTNQLLYLTNQSNYYKYSSSNDMNGNYFFTQVREYGSYILSFKIGDIQYDTTVVLEEGKIFDLHIDIGTVLSTTGDLESPTTYSLSQNYPNPFNPTTTIQYSIPKDEFVKLTVYDVAGKVIKELVSGHKTAGSYSVEFNATDYASGTYYYKLEAGEYKNIQKMMLIK
jgi:uncharacterized GH25 family protein